MDRNEAFLAYLRLWQQERGIEDGDEADLTALGADLQAMVEARLAKHLRARADGSQASEKVGPRTGAYLRAEGRLEFFDPEDSVRAAAIDAHLAAAVSLAKDLAAGGYDGQRWAADQARTAFASVDFSTGERIADFLEVMRVYREENP